MIIVDTILETINKAVDKIVPDANVREQVKAEVLKQSYEWAKLEVEDRASARQREMTVKDGVPATLAFVITAALVGGAVWFSFYPPTEENRALVEMFGSALRDGWIMMVAYYFGSSHSLRQANGK